MTNPRTVTLALLLAVLVLTPAPALRAEDEVAATEETAENGDGTTPDKDAIYEWTTPDEQKELEDTYRKFLEGADFAGATAEGGTSVTGPITGSQTGDNLLGQAQGLVASEATRTLGNAIGPLAARAGNIIGRAAPLAGSVLTTALTCAAQNEQSFGSCMLQQSPNMAGSYLASLAGGALIAAGAPVAIGTALGSLPFTLVLVAAANPEAFAGREAEAACDIDMNALNSFSFREAGRSVLNNLPAAPTTDVGP